MLQFYYSHRTPSRETPEKSTKLKRFLRRFLFLIITVEMVRRFSVCIFLSSFCVKLGKGQGVKLTCGFRKWSQSFLVESEAFVFVFCKKLAFSSGGCRLSPVAEQIFVADGGGKGLLLAGWIWKWEVKGGIVMLAAFASGCGGLSARQSVSPSLMLFPGFGFGCRWCAGVFP